MVSLVKESEETTIIKKCISIYKEFLTFQSSTENTLKEKAKELLKTYGNEQKYEYIFLNNIL